MKKIKFKWFAVVLGLAGLLVSSCATTGPDRIANDDPNDKVRVIENPLSLQDFLVKAGVTMDYQSGVPIIRGGAPLYVVDGMRMGHDYYQVVRMVNVNDIASVEVIKSTGEALMYGRDASNGVILIKTKTGA